MSSRFFAGKTGYVWQIPVELVVVQSIADHEHVGNREARVVCLDGNRAPRRLVEKNTYPDA